MPSAEDLPAHELRMESPDGPYMLMVDGDAIYVRHAEPELPVQPEEAAGSGDLASSSDL